MSRRWRIVALLELIPGTCASFQEPVPLAGILVDEQFGAAILRDESRSGYLTCVPVEKSRQAEFDFEFPYAFARHIEAYVPEIAKVLVRYNPDGIAPANGRQVTRLWRLSACLAARPSK